MSIFDWIYPKKCVGCGMRGKYVCDGCRALVRVRGESLVYEGLVRKMIKEIKYRQSRDMIGELIGMWTICSDQRAVRSDQGKRGVVITSVPMWEGKRRKRGFNQAELMARELARRWGVEYRELLVRVRETRPMYGLKPAEKMKNVAGAFCVNSKFQVSNIKHVVLVDDVVTSGATTQECRKVLLAGGVKSVRIVAVSR